MSVDIMKLLYSVEIPISLDDFKFTLLKVTV